MILVYNNNNEVCGEIKGNVLECTNVMINSLQAYGLCNSVINRVKDVGGVDTCVMKDKNTGEVFTFPFDFWINPQISFTPAKKMHLDMNQRLLSIKWCRNLGQRIL